MTTIIETSQPFAKGLRGAIASPFDFKPFAERRTALRYLATGAGIILTLNVAELFLSSSFSTAVGGGLAVLLVGIGLLLNRRRSRRRFFGAFLQYVGLGTVLGFVLSSSREYGSGLATAALAVTAITMLVAALVLAWRPAFRNSRHWTGFVVGTSALLAGVFPVVVWALGVYPISHPSLRNNAIVIIGSGAVSVAISRAVTARPLRSVIKPARATEIVR